MARPVHESEELHPPNPRRAEFPGAQADVQERAIRVRR